MPVTTPDDALDLEAIATIFRVTEKAVRGWIGRGMPILKAGRRGRGGAKTQISLRAAAEWYFAENFESLELDRQRTRLAEEQADKLMLENAKTRGEVARIADVVQFVGDHNANARARCLGIAPKLAPQLIDIHDPNVIAAAIRSEVHAALAELSEWEWQPPEAATPEGPTGAAGVDPASDADGQPVGRRRKKAQ